MYKDPKIDFLAAYNSRTGNGLVKNSVLPSAAIISNVLKNEMIKIIEVRCTLIVE
jgi:hypothetical protein